MVATISTALALLLTGSAEADVAAMTPREKAEAVVVAGMPAGPGFGGVLVRQWNADAPRPRGALTLADQEGGVVKTFRSLPPWRPHPPTRAPPRRARPAARRRLRCRAGVHAAFAPVLDLADGPLGSRHFARPEYGVAFARGLGRGGEALPSGLRPTPKSTDVARVYGVLRSEDLAPFRAVVRAGVPWRDGRPRDLPAARPAPGLVRAGDDMLLRRLGFRGVAITDSLGVLGSRYAPFWARPALRAGADLVLTTMRTRAGSSTRPRPARRRGRARREARQGAALPAPLR